MNNKELILVLIGGILIYFAFKEPAQDPVPTKPVVIQPSPDEAPMDIPGAMRVKNYKGGSCVHASVANVLRWQNKEALADFWKGKYAYGEYWSRLHGRLDREGIHYISTTRGDEAVLEFASKTRRGAIITYYPRHSIAFCGYIENDGQEFAVVLDNNRVNKLIWIKKSTFLSNWKHRYGGAATVPLYSPTPLQPWSVRNVKTSPCRCKDDCDCKLNCVDCVCSK